MWKPHSSLEGGSDTLAYGHKLTSKEVKSNTVQVGDDSIDLSDGLTEQQANELFEQDVEKAKSSLSKSVRGFDSLDKKYQDVLVSIQFNTGNVSEDEWSNLLAGIRAEDDERVFEEMLTSFKDSKGDKKLLSDRRNSIAKSLGIKGK